MFSQAQFVRVQKDLPVSQSRPTMIVEVEEPPTLTISSDEIAATVEKSCIILFRFSKKAAEVLGITAMSLYKKFSSLSVRVSFEEIQEAKPIPPKIPKVKMRYPGQLGLFADTAQEQPADGMMETPLMTGFTNKQEKQANIFWIMFIALSFGLAASMFLQ